MKKKLPLILVLSVLLCAALVFMGVSSAAGATSAQLLDAAVAGETELLKLGVVPAQKIERQLTASADLSAAADLAEAEKTDFARYYTGDLASKYEGISQTAWDGLDPAEFGLSVDSGVTQNRVIHVENISETEKKLKFSYVSWLTTIYEEQGKYTVWIMFNRDTQTNTMVKTDGQWKTASIESVDKESEPEGYDPDRGTFDTLAEALEFV